jgi:succinyl-diaminopimelate desuccinylase
VLSVEGVQGHSAYPQRADNPVPKIARMIDRLASAPLDAGSTHFEPSTLAVTSIDVGNPAANVIPARAQARFNIRFNDLHTAASLEADLRRTLEIVRQELGGDYRLDCETGGDCFLTEPGPLVETLCGAIEAVCGERPALATNGGTSDARFIKDHCPVVEFGLVGQTMHQVDERVAVRDLKTLKRIYAEMLERYFVPPGDGAAEPA